MGKKLKQIKTDLVGLMTKKMSETDISDRKKWIYSQACHALYKCYLIYLSPKPETNPLFPCEYKNEFSKKEFENFKLYVGYSE
jgi:hypothetical protein